MLAQLLWSLDLGIRAARGEPIADPEDLDKEISLFVREKRADRPERSDLETLDVIYSVYVRPTIEQLDGKMEQFSDLFRVREAMSQIRAGEQQFRGRSILEPGQWSRFREASLAGPEFALGQPDLTLVRMYRLADYCGEGREGFTLRLWLQWDLGRDERRFQVQLNGPRIDEACHTVSYARLGIDPPGVEARVETICRKVMEEIDRQSQEET